MLKVSKPQIKIFEAYSYFLDELKAKLNVFFPQNNVSYVSKSFLSYPRFTKQGRCQ